MIGGVAVDLLDDGQIPCSATLTLHADVLRCALPRGHKHSAHCHRREGVLVTEAETPGRAFVLIFWDAKL